MAKETGKKKFTAEEALMVLCSKDYSCSDLTSSESSNSDDEDNLDKLSQNSSVSSDQNKRNYTTAKKKLKIQIIEKAQHDHGQVQNHPNTSVRVPGRPTYSAAVQNTIPHQRDTTTGECGMSEHVDIQPQMTVTPIPSPEHVIFNSSWHRRKWNIWKKINHDELPFSTETLSSENEDTNDYYIIDSPSVTPQDYRYNEVSPIHNYARDSINPEDSENGWEKIEIDQEPFLDTPGLSLNTDSHNPEDFFNNLFDETMFTIIADATNDYAHGKIRSVLGERDPFQQIEHYSHRRHARLGSWKDMNASDIKIFIAHLLVMSSVRKTSFSQLLVKNCS